MIVLCLCDPAKQVGGLSARSRRGANPPRTPGVLPTSRPQASSRAARVPAVGSSPWGAPRPLSPLTGAATPAAAGPTPPRWAPPSSLRAPPRRAGPRRMWAGPEPAPPPSRGSRAGGAGPRVAPATWRRLRGRAWSRG